MAWSIRYVVLCAAAMILLGSETAAAGGLIEYGRTAPATTPRIDRLTRPRPAPDPQVVRFTTSARGTDDRETEREARPISDTEVTIPNEPSEAPPTDTPPTENGTIAPLTRPVVVLYGDSLAWEARHVFEGALAEQPVQVVTRTFGGTAICDWHDEMVDDAATLRPGLVIIEFVGNNYTPCMQDPAGEALVGAALVDRYAAAAEIAIATFAAIDAQVVFAGAPIARPSTATLDLHRAPLNGVYQELSERLDDVFYVDAGSSVLDGGEWTNTLPCLPIEPCGGSGAATNSVRAPDGLHFCPASAAADRGVTGDCPVWSSGAFRYGTALAQPVFESLAAMPPSDGG